MKSNISPNRFAIRLNCTRWLAGAALMFAAVCGLSAYGYFLPSPSDGCDLYPPGVYYYEYEVTASSITIHWSAVSGAATYGVWLNNNLLTILPPYTFSLEFETVPNTTYQFAVGARTDQGECDPFNYQEPHGSIVNVTSLNSMASVRDGSEQGKHKASGSLGGALSRTMSYFNLTLPNFHPRPTESASGDVRAMEIRSDDVTSNTITLRMPPVSETIQRGTTYYYYIYRDGTPLKPSTGAWPIPTEGTHPFIYTDTDGLAAGQTYQYHIYVSNDPKDPQTTSYSPFDINITTMPLDWTKPKWQRYQ